MDRSDCLLGFHGKLLMWEKSRLEENQLSDPD